MQGGFGYTVESDVTLYFRRAKGSSVVGEPMSALREVGEALARATPREAAPSPLELDTEGALSHGL
jgi:hypothetical protein